LTAAMFLEHRYSSMVLIPLATARRKCLGGNLGE
jgi:hypothetical protein